MSSDSNDDRYVVISTDCHAGASIQGYKPYLDARWHDDFEGWASTFSDPWGEQGEADNKMGLASYDSRINWESDLRRDLLESEGIVGEVIFPNTAPPFFPSGVIGVAAPTERDDYQRRMAGLRAHNRWLADFCDALPGQRAGVGQVFLNDIDDTLEEIRWIAEHLTGGIVIPGDAPGVAVALYYSRYDPIWQLCAELGVPVHRHSGFPGEPISLENGLAGSAIGLVENSFFAHRGLAHLILAGVFDRHPDLQFVLTESGASWVPGYLAELDTLYDAALVSGSIVSYFAEPAVRALRRRPSEYFAMNCHLGASFLTAPEAALRHEIGLDRIMWGSDLPHAEGTYPYTLEALRATFAPLPRDDVEQILARTPAELYGFDMGLLQGIADRVGPRVADVHRPLTDAERPSTPDQTITPALAPMPIAGYIESTKVAAV
jgi:predicted TIM-barrel fold metal-dependent hydrolase